MSIEIIINATEEETRVAILENKTVTEFYVDRKKDRGIVGNVYKGKVVKVLPGMQAAFVDIGQEKAAFLYVSDVRTGADDYGKLFEEDPREKESESEEEGHDARYSGEEPEAAGETQGTVEETSEDLQGSLVEEAPFPDSALEDGQDEGETEPADLLDFSPGEPSRPDSPEETISQDAAPGEVPLPVFDVPGKDLSPADVAVSPLAVELDQVVSHPPAQEVLPQPSGEEVPAGEPVAVLQAPVKPAPQQGKQRSRNRGRFFRNKPKQRRVSRSIEELLKEGQDVVVQVSKDAMGTKGPRVTTYISLPGRYLVFMPNVNHIGISRRIGGGEERGRLKEMLHRLRRPGSGYIIRTVSEGTTEEEFRSDMEFLEALW
ncbi:MAG TPA: ribonuclease E/G, partial [Nitrospiria bacterium]|nr:ribonuclease E/G [Nitrospiria bacterium]